MRMLKFALLSGSLAALAAAASASPYRQVAVTPVPAMPEGDWDQLVADETHNRLYVSAEDGAAMDVFDLTTGALLQAGGPVGSPHKVALDAAAQHLLVADGQDGTVKVLTPDLRLVKAIPVGARPDTGVLDAEARIFYVSSRNGAGTAPDSIVSAISLDSLAVVKTFAVPATTLKGLVQDKPGHRLFVSMRDKDRIGVIALDTGEVTTWAAEGLKKSVPLAFDPANQRLYAGSREPGRLTVFDATTGKVVQLLPLTETADSMTLDHGGKRLYVSGDTGMSRYAIGKGGVVRFLETDPGVVGKTSLYVAGLHRLYVMRPRTKDMVAALQVFSVTAGREE
ncbi:MAG TPA: YncE family protein [Sphingomonas sp.]|nr:YncE family protein [Sphingomonas sp.]